MGSVEWGMKTHRLAATRSGALGERKIDKAKRATHQAVPHTGSNRGEAPTRFELFIFVALLTAHLLAQPFAFGFGEFAIAVVVAFFIVVAALAGAAAAVTIVVVGIVLSAAWAFR